jgi:hypothetical protein
VRENIRDIIDISVGSGKEDILSRWKRASPLVTVND